MQTLKEIKTVHISATDSLVTLLEDAQDVGNFLSLRLCYLSLMITFFVCLFVCCLNVFVLQVYSVVTEKLFSRTGPSFAAVHTFCASRGAPRKSNI